MNPLGYGWGTSSRTNAALFPEGDSTWSRPVLEVEIVFAHAGQGAGGAAAHRPMPRGWDSEIPAIKPCAPWVKAIAGWVGAGRRAAL